jgi:ribokinase
VSERRRVAVVGHVEWVDFVPVGSFPVSGQVIHSAGAFARAAGGGGVVAAVLAELGAEVDFFCALGEDESGRAAATQLRERGINLHVAWRGDQPTRRALTLLEPGGERTIITIGERLQPRGADELEWDRLGTADGVYFTAGDAEALRRARAAGVLVVSPRARSALEAEAIALDAIVFSAGDADEREWAARVAGRARLVVATEGPAGGRWEGESTGRWEAATPPGEPRDAYGCGDSFAAGFTFGLACGFSVSEAAAAGARRGALCLTRSGAP